MKFDPFENRLCRNVRNQIGHNFVKALEAKDHDGFKSKANVYISLYPHRHITDYIQIRLNGFKTIIGQLNALEDHPDTFYTISRMLWNQGLFFEFHEWLEGKWTGAKGDRKNMLQALIMASVVYEQLQYERISPAKKMAGKALKRLKKYNAFIPAEIDTGSLIEELRCLSLPPRL